jgi:hypothetical protein
MAAWLASTGKLHHLLPAGHAAGCEVVCHRRRGTHFWLALPMVSRAARVDIVISFSPGLWLKGEALFA